EKTDLFIQMVQMDKILQHSLLLQYTCVDNCLESTLEPLDWNASQEHYNFSLDVLHRLQFLSSKLSLQSVVKNITRTYGVVRRLGQHGILVLGK
ncbi:hypothetical protein J6590_106504, partial [Homalodisca vitripennis]